MKVDLSGIHFFVVIETTRLKLRKLQYIGAEGPGDYAKI